MNKYTLIFSALLCLFCLKLKAQNIDEKLIIQAYKRCFFLKCIPYVENERAIFYETYSGMIPYELQLKKIHLLEIDSLYSNLKEEMIKSNKEVISESHGVQMVPTNYRIISACLDYYESVGLDSMAKRAAKDVDYYKKQ